MATQTNQIDPAEPQRATLATRVLRVDETVATPYSDDVDDLLTIEEPLSIQLIYGQNLKREAKSIAITMRTPGFDPELAAGFLYTEGIVRDSDEIQSVREVTKQMDDGSPVRNTVIVELAPEVEVNLSSLERNFYTTSSCGICGKASLVALRTVCPPRRVNELTISSEVVYSLPDKLRAAQVVFQNTGGLHGAALFDVQGNLSLLREDVGRHNAVDKLIGNRFLADEVPMRKEILLLSGRVSFELMQKAVMAGIPAVIAVGAPSSLAVEVAREFDITLIAFLRGRRFNAYHGAERITGLPQQRTNNKETTL